MDCEITTDEILRAIQKGKRRKAGGVDEIPLESLANKTAVSTLKKLFNCCYDTGIIPSDWEKSIINPIPKDLSKDQRDPMNYRGISLTCSTYKLYCSVLLSRLQTWIDEQDILSDEQNGFRKGRSCMDHIISLISVAQTRITSGADVFAGFVDFSKAFDCVNRQKLWKKLINQGLSTKFVNALCALYKNVQSSVRVNGQLSEWFEVSCGLKQGCLLSPVLFAIFLDDLIKDIKSLNTGVNIDGGRLCILAYADDIVLVANTAEELQNMLNVLSTWCKNNDMVVNVNKTNILHLRKPSKQKTNYTFVTDGDTLEIVTQYRYLGFNMNEHLDMNYSAKCTAQAASRALGLLIAKSKACGGMPYTCFSTLYDALVGSVINYSAGVWGHRQFSPISAVQNRATRFYLGVGKYTPNAATQGDMGWKISEHRQWLCVIRLWCRLKDMDPNRINYRAFAWARRLALQNKKNWCYYVIHNFRKIGTAFAKFLCGTAPLPGPTHRNWTL